tara:strand:- start:62666 stop:63820 length:1155 start_codon:yes stop_codon:yes gene_type:complete
MAKGLSLFILLFSVLVLAEDARLPEVKLTEDLNKVVQKFDQQKSQLLNVEVEHRKVLGDIFSINSELKETSEKRAKLQNKLVSAEADVKYLSRDIAKLKIKISDQKKWLGRRLRAIYKFHNMGSLSIFLNKSFKGNLDRNMRYLKSIADRDYELINSYQKNLFELQAKNQELKGNVKTLVSRQKQLSNLETELDVAQETKSKILGKINQSKTKFKRQFEELKNEAKKLNISEADFNEIINMDFYMQKGRLPWPVSAPIVQRFGLMENHDYKFKLYSKGLRFNVAAEESIHSVFKGTVDYAGELPGVGNVVVVNHGSNYFSVYTGMDQLSVVRGTSLLGGESLGSVKKRAKSIFFEIRHFSDAINPEHWLDKKLLVKNSNNSKAS